MSVEKLFWQDPYRTECDVQIVSVNGNVVTVDQTIFYAFSGGQESDTGWIGELRVIEARKDGFEMLYTLEHGYKPGAQPPCASTGIAATA